MFACLLVFSLSYVKLLNYCFCNQSRQGGSHKGNCCNRTHFRQSQGRPFPLGLRSPFGAIASPYKGICSPYSLAHRNRSDFCDLRLRCPSRTPEIGRFPKQEKAMPLCDLRVRWKVASDLRFRAAISEPGKTPSFCGISGDLVLSTRKSLAIAIVRFWCAKPYSQARKRNPTLNF